MAESSEAANRAIDVDAPLVNGEASNEINGVQAVPAAVVEEIARPDFSWL
jgi:hypothetical protein